VSNNNVRLLGVGGIILIVLICGGFSLNYLIKNLPVATATAPSGNDTPAFEIATLTDVPFTPAPLPTETLIPTPALGIGSTEISPKDGMNLLYIPAGEFLMGSTNTDTLASGDEKPQHPVTLDAYWIDQAEVTNSQYAKCVADNGACKEPTNKSSSTHSSYYGNSEFDHYPVL
jgi:formylglycine-generating enzyme required for sulfatase activity